MIDRAVQQYFYQEGRKAPLIGPCPLCQQRYENKMRPGLFMTYHQAWVSGWYEVNFLEKQIETNIPR